MFIQPLESRTMLGGHPISNGGVTPSNVTAVVVDGDDVQIRGDTGSNTITIKQVGATGKKIKITGLNGTTINNNASVTLSGVDDIDIRMGDGTDSVAVSSLALSGSLVIDSGAGNDSTTIAAVAIRGLLKLRGHAGVNVITLQDITVGERTIIKTWAGDDVINIDGSTFSKRVDIRTGLGSDTINIERVSANPLNTTFRQAADFRFADDDDDLNLGISQQSGNQAIFQGAAYFDGGRGNSDFETENNVSFNTGQPTLWRWEID